MEFPKNWEIRDDFLTKMFEFDDFVGAVDFVKKIVPLAEEMSHHPDIDLFSYNKVRIKLMTHDEGKVTEKDIKLARKIDDIR